MFKGNTFWQIIHIGGFAMYVLVGCSILSLTIMLERFLYYARRSRPKRAELIEQIKESLEKGNVKNAMQICQNVKTPFANVINTGLNLFGRSEREISNAMERTITIETTKLERYTAIVGTIGSTAVYIGLLGTVLGIIRAFRDISTSGMGGTSVVVSGISEALVCTAAGLCVAVPAVIAYNYFMKRVDFFVTDMELCASEIKDLASTKAK